MAEQGSLQQSSESAEAVNSKLHKKLADLREEMPDKTINICPIQELLSTGMSSMLKTLDKLAFHEQIARLEQTVRRMQRLLDRNVLSEPAEKIVP